MKVMCIGSAVYIPRIKQHVEDLEYMGHEARMAAYDDLVSKDEYGICLSNLEGIRWADVVHMFWDSRSIGTQFDMGMAFALGKPLKIIVLNPKTLRNFALQYHGASTLRVSKLEGKPCGEMNVPSS